MGSLRARFRKIEKVLLFLLICIGGAILLRWGVLAGYPVRSGSMAPTLHGNPGGGDKVAVFKLQYKLFEPDRYDLVVFFRKGDFPFKPGLFEPSGGSNFVKRLVAFPGETLRILDGDLYIWEAQGEPATEPDRKPLDVSRSMSIPVYRAVFDDGFFDDWVRSPGGSDGRIEIRDGGLFLDLTSDPELSEVALQFAPRRGAIFDDYPDRNGDLHEGRHPVRDILLTLEATFEADGGEISACLREGGDKFRFVLRSRAAGGGGTLYLNPDRADRRAESIPAKAFPGFVAGETFEILFMNVDNRILLLVDGAVIVDHPYGRNGDLRGDKLFNAPAIGAKDARLFISKIQIDRDIYYTDYPGSFAVRSGCPVPSGHYFFLGDNSPESVDSRTFGTVSREDFVGRPFMIFYPFHRLRFF